MDRLLRKVLRTGFRRGMKGKHPIWFVIGVAAWMLTRARRHHDEVSYRTVLQPGEALVVDTAAPTRR